MVRKLLKPTPEEEAAKMSFLGGQTLVPKLFTPSSGRPISPEEIKSPQVFRDEQGRLSGVELPGGKVFLGLNPKDVKKIIQDFKEERELPEGAVDVGTASELKRRRQLGTELAARIGQLSPGILEQIQRGEIDIGQILGGGAAAAIPGIAGGAATGALAGSVVPGAGTVVGAIGGAIVGGVGAFIVGARSSLKSQKQGNIQAGAGALADGEMNLRKFITAANRDPSNAAEYQALFNEQLSYIERDYGILKLDTQGFLKDLSGADGTPQLANYQRFYDISRDFYIEQMQTALLNPNPNKSLITPEEAGLG